MAQAHTRTYNNMCRNYFFFMQQVFVVLLLAISMWKTSLGHSLLQAGVHGAN